jgi:hypothetical protein
MKNWSCFITGRAKMDIDRRTLFKITGFIFRLFVRRTTMYAIAPRKDVALEKT